jgi:hypothetical protein
MKTLIQGITFMLALALTLALGIAWFNGLITLSQFALASVIAFVIAKVVCND